MAHPNEDLAREAYRAMSTGDIPWLEAHTHPDVVFYQGGRFPTAGTYKGRDALFAHFMEFMQLVDGNFSIELHDVLANDDHVVALIGVTIGKEGRELTFDEAHVWHIRDGLMTQMWAVPQDPYVVDEFFANLS